MLSLVSIAFLQSLTRLSIEPGNVYHLEKALRPAGQPLHLLPHLLEFRVHRESVAYEFYTDCLELEVDIGSQTLQTMQAFPNLQTAQLTVTSQTPVNLDIFDFSDLPNSIRHLDVECLHAPIDRLEHLVSFSEAASAWIGDLAATPNLRAFVLEMDWKETRDRISVEGQLTPRHLGEEREAAHRAAIEDLITFYPALLASCPTAPEAMDAQDLNAFLRTWDTYAYSDFERWALAHEATMLWQDLLESLHALRDKLDERGIRYRLNVPDQDAETPMPRGKARGERWRASPLKQLTL